MAATRSGLEVGLWKTVTSPRDPPQKDARPIRRPPGKRERVDEGAMAEGTTQSEYAYGSAPPNEKNVKSRYNTLTNPSPLSTTQRGVAAPSRVAVPGEEQTVKSTISRPRPKTPRSDLTQTSTFRFTNQQNVPIELYLRTNRGGAMKHVQVASQGSVLRVFGDKKDHKSKKAMAKSSSQEDTAVDALTLLSTVMANMVDETRLDAAAQDGDEADAKAATVLADVQPPQGAARDPDRRDLESEPIPDTADSAAAAAAAPDYKQHSAVNGSDDSEDGDGDGGANGNDEDDDDSSTVSVTYYRSQCTVEFKPGTLGLELEEDAEMQQVFVWKCLEDGQAWDRRYELEGSRVIDVNGMPIRSLNDFSEQLAQSRDAAAAATEEERSQRHPPGTIMVTFESFASIEEPENLPEEAPRVLLDESAGPTRQGTGDTVSALGSTPPSTGMRVSSSGGGWEFMTGGGAIVDNDEEGVLAAPQQDKTARKPLGELMAAKKEEDDKKDEEDSDNDDTESDLESVPIAATLPVGLSRSSEDIRTVLLQFCNRSAGSFDLEVYWIDYHGKAILRRILNDGEAHLEQSYATHSWFVAAVPSLDSDSVNSGRASDPEWNARIPVMVVRVGECGISEHVATTGLWTPGRQSMSLMPSTRRDAGGPADRRRNRARRREGDAKGVPGGGKHGDTDNEAVDDEGNAVLRPHFNLVVLGEPATGITSLVRRHVEEKRQREKARIRAMIGS